MQVVIKSVRCGHGICRFCGLGLIDKPYDKPLSEGEFTSQLADAMERHRDSLARLEKFCILGNAHSVFAEDVIGPAAFREGVALLAAKLPMLRMLSFETRAEHIIPATLSGIAAMASTKTLRFEAAVGVESAYESVRQAHRKGLTDQMLFDAAKTLEESGWALRAYFIYHLPGRAKMEAGNDLELAACLLGRIKEICPHLPITLYLHASYVPQAVRRRAVYRDFDLPTEEELARDLMAITPVCKKLGLQIDVEASGNDEMMTDANAIKMGRESKAALEAFNSSNDASYLERILIPR